MRSPNKLLLQQGYVPASKVAVIFCKHLSTIHRMCDSGKLKNIRDGTARYIKIADIRDYWKGNPVMLKSIESLKRWADAVLAERESK